MTQQQELLTKSLYSAEFLLSELQELNSETENFCLSVICIDLIKKVREIKNRLEYLEYNLKQIKIPLENCNLSTITYNALKKNNFNFLNDLVKTPKKQLLNIKLLGYKGIISISKELKKHFGVVLK